MPATAVRGAKWGAYLGPGCGIVYSVGGLIWDLATIGLNWGTAMAFVALVGMPALFAAGGFLLGLLVASVLQVVDLARWAASPRRAGTRATCTPTPTGATATSFPT